MPKRIDRRTALKPRLRLTAFSWVNFETVPRFERLCQFLAVLPPTRSDNMETATNSKHANPLPQFWPRKQTTIRGYNRGSYLMICHNLEHEDYDMMMRFDVV